ncbi:hypothetical protein P4T51_22370 [Bacillus mycoides]|uniref:hypothetical protein n=1 Tax=Bacillus mycoides TaxID=1405 RepID=UPI002E24EE40|nr:hypothetical protein [Bacillus mycoides]
MIKISHQLIHEATLDFELGKERMDNYVVILECFSSIFIKLFMEKYNLRLLIDEEL